MAISGKGGKAQIGSTDISEITKWSFNPTSNNSAWASSDTSGYKKRVAGVKDGSGSIEGVFDEEDEIYLTFEPGDSITLKLYIDASKYYSVPSLIDSFSIEVDLNDGEVVGWSADFSINGAWTKPT
jgi:hypothetical protein